MIYTMTGILILIAISEAGTRLINRQTEKVLDRLSFDEDMSIEDLDDFIDEEPINLTNWEKIQFFMEDLLEKLPITNVLIAYDAYLDVKEYEKNNTEVSNKLNKDKKENQEGTRRQKDTTITPTTILLTYTKQEKEGEILYHIYNGQPKIINTTGAFATLSLLEQSELVRKEYQECKSRLDETLRGAIDDILESPKPINDIEELLDVENVFIGNLGDINNGKFPTRPYQAAGKTSHINPKILQRK